MSEFFAPWVEEAAPLPIAFAQVREDPWLDQGVIERMGKNTRVVMIASGGCTAAVLATHPLVTRLHLVDPNPAQLALTRLKLRLLQTASPRERLEILGHLPQPASQRQEHLTREFQALGLSADCLGPLHLVSEWGPDQSGRYERVFAALQNALKDHRGSLDSLLRLNDPTEQEKRAGAGTTLGRHLDEALDEVMALPNLVRLFGEEATRNPVEPFPRHFARRIRHVLATLPAATNPYLWQMLAGRFPEETVHPWISLGPPARLPTVTWSNGFMAEVLEKEAGANDFVHLSNILDWLSPEKARATLELAGQALRPGGWTLIRQLNSSLDIPSFGPQFEWFTAQAAELHAQDRSFFYRALHLGRKR